MEPTTSLYTTSSPSALPPRPLSGHSFRRKKVSGIGRSLISVSASKRDHAHSHNFNGKLVDENMIILRKRIQEMNMSEKKYEPPKHWMEWEKAYKESDYDIDVCEAVGYLQSKLMETRPSVALGIITLVLLSVPTSMYVLLFHVMAMTKGL